MHWREEMKEIGIGIIGCGFMGTTFARIVAEGYGTRLMGVADIDGGRAEALGRQWHTSTHTDYRELLRVKNLDAVVVATPEDAHLEPCVAAATAGKHVFVEKPLATVQKDGEAIIEATRRAGVVLLVGHSLRFNPQHYMAHEAIVSGRLGDLIHMYSRRNGPLKTSGLRLAGRTSVAWWVGIHDIDFMNWCTQSQVRNVYARARRKAMAHLNADDTIFSLLEYDNGVLACVEVSWVMPDCPGVRTSTNFEAVGTAGWIDLNPNEQGLVIHDPTDASEPRPFGEPIMYGRKWGVYNTEISHFLDCIVKGDRPICTGEEALSAVVVVEAVLRSLNSGERVDLA
jgi:predicted dehydrogenase